MNYSLILYVRSVDKLIGNLSSADLYSHGSKMRGVSALFTSTSAIQQIDF